MEERKELYVLVPLTAQFCVFWSRGPHLISFCTESYKLCTGLAKMTGRNPYVSSRALALLGCDSFLSSVSILWQPVLLRVFLSTSGHCFSDNFKEHSALLPLMSTPLPTPFPPLILQVFQEYKQTHQETTSTFLCFPIVRATIAEPQARVA